MIKSRLNSDRFSCLMSFYKNDNPVFLDKAFDSLNKQTLKASQIILVQDGDVSVELLQIVEIWMRKLPIERVINMDNLGLGYSLNKGLQLCSEEIVARMDSDDICHPKRFELQFLFLKNNPDVSVVGSWISEFSNDIKNIDTHRRLPEGHKDLYDFAKKRSPLNHPSVMFKKSHIQKVGGYKSFRFQQDYHLWGRLLNAGFKIANIPEVLLYMRVDEKLFKRRGGMDYYLIEKEIQRDFLRIGFIGRKEYYRNLFLRGTVRLIPNFLRIYLYRFFLR